MCTSGQVSANESGTVEFSASSLYGDEAFLFAVMQFNSSSVLYLRDGAGLCPERKESNDTSKQVRKKILHASVQMHGLG